MVHSANNSPLSKLTELNDLPTAKQYFIAYSGGIDSTALLHALSLEPALSGLLTAIHVNHNINSAATHWAEHCQIVCNELNISLITASVDLNDSSEATCRQARQHVFKQHLGKGDCLLTAHHQNDQIETVLFRLLRGTGLQGMTGIAKTNNFDHYKIHRPLLLLNKEQIKTYVLSNQLSYIDDPSNQDNHYRRNHIRNLIVPELEKYDVQALQNIGLTVQNLQQSHQLLNHLIGNNNPFNYQLFVGSDELSTALYHWLNNIDVQAPNRKRFIQFSQDCLLAKEDKNPELLLDDCCLVRWHKHIYALKNSEALPDTEIYIELNSDKSNITLPQNGELLFESTTQVTIPAVIKYRQNHQRIQLDVTGQHKKLKKLFQQSLIPPWERKTIPYLYIDNQLMAVGSDILSADFKILLSEYKAEYRWLSPQYIL